MRERNLAKEEEKQAQKVNLEALQSKLSESKEIRDKLSEQISERNVILVTDEQKSSIRLFIFLFFL